MDAYMPTVDDKELIYNSLLSLSQFKEIDAAADHILDMLMELDDIDMCVFYQRAPQSDMRLISMRNVPAAFMSIMHMLDEGVNSPLVQHLGYNKPQYITFGDLMQKIAYDDNATGGELCLRAMGLIPIKANGETVSSLNFASFKYDEFTPRTKWVAEKLAKDTSMTIKRIIDDVHFNKNADYYETLFNLSTNMFIISDFEGNILSANATVTEKLGYTQGELKKMKVFDIHPPEMKSEIFKKLDELIEGKIPICDIPCMTKDLELIPVYTKLNISSWWDKDVIVCETADISDLIERDTALSHKRDIDNALVKASEKFISSDDVNYNDIIRMIGTTLGIDRAYIYMFRDGMTKMDNTNEWCAEGIGSQMFKMQDLDCDMAPWWMEMLHGRKTIRITNVEQMPKMAYKERELMNVLGTKSMLIVPIISSNELVGFMGFNQNRYSRAWSDDDVNVLRVVSQSIGSHIKRSKLIKMVIEEKNIIWSTRMALEEFTSELYHDMQTPLITANAYLDVLCEAIGNQDLDEIGMCMNAIKRAFSEISANAAKIGNRLREGNIEEIEKLSANIDRNVQKVAPSIFHTQYLNNGDNEHPDRPYPKIGAK